MSQNLDVTHSNDWAGLDVSRRLLAHRDEILQLWKERLRTDIPVARSLEEPLLVNSLPDWLDRVIQALASPDSPFRLQKASSTAKEHGRQRTSIKYDLNQILFEYIVLQQVILDVLDRETTLAPRQRNIILDAIQLSMRASAIEHSKLHRRGKEMAILEKSEQSRTIRALITFSLVSGATGLQWLLWPVITPMAYFLFYPIIVLATLVGDGLLAIVLSALLAEYLFVPPPFELSVTDGTGGYRVLLFLITAFVISKITERLRMTQTLTENALEQQQKARHEAELSADEAKAARGELERTVAVLNQEREVRERLIAAVSHDLRGPLAAAKTSLQTFQRYSDQIESRERFLTRMDRSIERANRMIEDLLDANRIQAGQGVPMEFIQCDLVEAVQDTVEELSAAHGDRFRLKAPEHIEGYWSPRGIQRLVENLCNNALKYGTADSPITVTLSRDPDGVRLAVHNIGSFIPPEERENLFKLFQRSRTADISGQKGWGIGLTIVQGITEAHGGRVSIESHSVDGTTFVVTLPSDARRS